LVAAGLAAAVGVGFAAAVALAAPWLRTAVDVDRFRFGSAIALAVLPLGLFGLVPGDGPLALAVLGIAAVLAFDPSDLRDAARAYERHDGPDASLGTAETLPDEELADAHRYRDDDRADGLSP
jgi:hypothetical protein